MERVVTMKSIESDRPKGVLLPNPNFDYRTADTLRQPHPAIAQGLTRAKNVKNFGARLNEDRKKWSGVSPAASAACRTAAMWSAIASKMYPNLFVIQVGNATDTPFSSTTGTMRSTERPSWWVVRREPAPVHPGPAENPTKPGITDEFFAAGRQLAAVLKRTVRSRAVANTVRH